MPLRAAVAAIQMSVVGIGVPALRSCATISAYCRLVSESTGSTCITGLSRKASGSLSLGPRPPPSRNPLRSSPGATVGTPISLAACISADRRFGTLEVLFLHREASA